MEHLRTFNSFSGADMVASFDVPQSNNTIKHSVFGEISTLSYSLYTPTYPARALGYRGPKGFTKGVRTIAGSLVFVVFDHHIIYQLYDNAFRDRILLDELPPFNITVACANEFGTASAFRIYGVTFLEEGQTMSIEDIYTEQVLRYMARDIVYLDPRNMSHGVGN